MAKAEKTLRVRIQAPDTATLRRLPLRQIDMGCMGGVRVQNDGSVALEALVRDSVLKTLKAPKVKVEVLADAGAEGKKKQRQVGRGNRFKGKDWIPRGLGKKARDRVK